MYLLHIPADGSIQQVEADGFSLDVLQRLVGGYIEIVHPLCLVPPYAMVVDDEGRCKGKTPNSVASYLYGGPIAGDAVIMATGTNEAGEADLVGLTQEQAVLCYHYLDEIAQRLSRRVVQ